MSVLGSLVFFFFWKHHMQRRTTETSKPSVALEILLFNFGGVCFIWEGFAVTHFITLTFLYPW